MYEGYTATNFVDYPDTTTDITTLDPATHGDCINHCDKEPTCVGFVQKFITGRGPGECVLKSKMDPNEAIVSTDHISYK
jgi:hypothetical protein